MWLVRGPYDVLQGAEASVGKLGTVVRAALDRSGPLTEPVDTTKAQDGELIRAAGFKSRKQFVAATAMCSLECDDGSTVNVRGSTKAVKGLSWIPDPDAIEVSPANTTELAEVVRALLLR
jgi:hypothetical protein